MPIVIIFGILPFVFLTICLLKRWIIDIINYYQPKKCMLCDGMFVWNPSIQYSAPSLSTLNLCNDLINIINQYAMQPNCQQLIHWLIDLKMLDKVKLRIAIDEFELCEEWTVLGNNYYFSVFHLEYKNKYVVYHLLIDIKYIVQGFIVFSITRHIKRRLGLWKLSMTPCSTQEEKKIHQTEMNFLKVNRRYPSRYYYYPLINSSDSPNPNITFYWISD